MSRKEREVLTLSCKLNQKELREKSIEHADKLNEIDQLNKEMDDYKKGVKGQIAKLESEENILRDQVASGRVYRPVECTIFWDWEKKKKTWRRTDTNEFVKEEPVTEYELQEEMKLREEQEHDAEVEKEIDESMDEENEELLVE